MVILADGRSRGDTNYALLIALPQSRGQSFQRTDLYAIAFKKSWNINGEHVCQLKKFGHVQTAVAALVLGNKALWFPQQPCDFNLRKPRSLAFREE